MPSGDWAGEGYCKATAGRGTSHVGEGRCKHHGGNNKGGNLKHGRYSAKNASRLQEKVEAFRDDPEPGSLWEELALQRAVLQDFNQRVVDGLSKEEAEHIFAMTEAITRTVDRINKIMSRTALTGAEIEYLQARYADILKRYVPADSRAAALRELRGAVREGS